MRTTAVSSLLAILALGLGLSATAPAGEGVSWTFAAPMERVWTAAERGLRAEGWSIDHADRPTGTVATRSRRLEGDDDGIQAKNLRVRLHLQIAPAASGQTLVRVEREHFTRERVLWIEWDRPLVPATDPAVPPDRTLEQRVLTAIGKAL